MKTFAIIGVSIICLIMIGLQHLFNYFLRKGNSLEGEEAVGFILAGVFGIGASLIILWFTISYAIQAFGNLPQ